MKRDHDRSGVMKFATSPAWGEHLGEALGDHLGLAMEEFDFEAYELADIVGDHWAGVLWGCAFEDLLTRTIEPGDRNIRSEEHTSELQSLMRISYAVFCLKKKKIKLSTRPKKQE